MVLVLDVIWGTRDGVPSFFVAFFVCLINLKHVSNCSLVQVQAINVLG